MTSRLALLAAATVVLAGCGGHAKRGAITCQAFEQESGLSVEAKATGSDADCRRLLRQVERAGGGFWIRTDPTPGEVRGTVCRMHGKGGVVIVSESRSGVFGLGAETCSGLEAAGFTQGR